MRSAIIYDLPDWQVTSWGNGLAYEIQHKASGRDLFFQGDNAEIFREQFDSLTMGAPCLEFADALAVIWSDYQEVVE